MNSMALLLVLCGQVTTPDYKAPVPDGSECGFSPENLGEEVNVAEILRRGNLVELVNGLRGTGVPLFEEAMAPPKSDADKWFISVLTKRNCPVCKRLKRDWNASKDLRALAIPGDPKASWAHFKYFSGNDKSQQYKFKGIKLTAYPTILVQPPLSKKYGSPSTVVFQQGSYSGKPELLAKNIRLAVKKYLYTRPPRIPETVPTQQVLDREIGEDPPWNPDTDSVLPPEVRRPFRIPPTDPKVEGLRITNAVTKIVMQAVKQLMVYGLTFTGGLAVVISILLYIRKLRVEAGQSSIISDEQLALIIKLLKGSIDEDGPVKPAVVKPTRRQAPTKKR